MDGDALRAHGARQLFIIGVPGERIVMKHDKKDGGTYSHFDKDQQVAFPMRKGHSSDVSQNKTHDFRMTSSTWSVRTRNTIGMMQRSRRTRLIAHQRSRSRNTSGTES